MVFLMGCQEIPLISQLKGKYCKSKINPAQGGVLVAKQKLPLLDFDVLGGLLTLAGNDLILDLCVLVDRAKSSTLYSGDV